MEQKPILTLFFYGALIILGALFLRQSLPLLWQSHQQQRLRTVSPAELIELSHEKVPLPGGGQRGRLRSCRYRYTHEGRVYESQGFSIFESSLYSRDLKPRIDRIRQSPQAWIDPDKPMEAVLLLDPPQAVLTSLLIGLLFLHGGLVLTGLWLWGRGETRRISRIWLDTQTLHADKSSLFTPFLLVPGVTILGLLFLSWSLVPLNHSVIGFAGFSILLTAAAQLITGLNLVLQSLRMRGRHIDSISWKPHAGLHFSLADLSGCWVILKVQQLRETRFSWGYRQTGKAEFEPMDKGFSLLPYSFKPAPGWYRPMAILSQSVRTENKRMEQESEALCQILAGQSSRHKGRSLLMGLMRKKPDHRLTIILRGQGLVLTYPLPVAFWTSEISR